MYRRIGKSPESNLIWIVNDWRRFASWRSEHVSAFWNCYASSRETKTPQTIIRRPFRQSARTARVFSPIIPIQAQINTFTCSCLDQFSKRIAQIDCRRHLCTRRRENGTVGDHMETTEEPEKGRTNRTHHGNKVTVDDGCQGDSQSSSTQDVVHREAPIVPHKLCKADVEAIIWRFRSDDGVQKAAQNHGLDDFQLKDTVQSFKKGIKKTIRKDEKVYSLMCEIHSEKAHMAELFPYFLKQAHELFPMHSYNMEKLKKISDLRGPHDLFPKARRLRRKIVYHAGPTNSGKTYQALERFNQASSAMYCAPLRLLATEVYRKANQAGVPCDLVTGEERLWATSVEEPASHVACTVEMSSTKQHYECVVLDEIQMMRDPDRGWAWTRALLGVLCDEIHVCGEDTAVDLVRRLAEACGDELEVHIYERLGPLRVLPYSLGGKLYRMRPGDCVVAFSQRELFKLRQRIERTTRSKCAIVYGGLPPATRVEQASKFNDPDDQHNILVASDAIGMGLNLNIKRIIFHAVEKFDGQAVSELTPSHAKQIAGRAGRFASEHPKGEVTTLYSCSLAALKRLMNEPSDKVQCAGLSPTLEQIKMLSHQLPSATLANLMGVFLDVAQLDGDNYFMCDLEDVQFLAELIEGIPLSIGEQYWICQAPVSRNRTLSSAVIVEFAHRVSRREEAKATDLMSLVGWPPSMPKSLKSLQDVESLHKMCDVYLWLSYRFPEVFVDQTKVRKMQDFVERVISAAVTSNLKQRGMPIIQTPHDDVTSKGYRTDDDTAITGTGYNTRDNASEEDTDLNNEGWSSQNVPRDPGTLQLSSKDFDRLRGVTTICSAAPTLPGPSRPRRGADKYKKR